MKARRSWRSPSPTASATAGTGRSRRPREQRGRADDARIGPADEPARERRRERRRVGSRALADEPSGSAPQVLERHAQVAQDVGRHAEDGLGRAGVEADPGHHCARGHHALDGPGVGARHRGPSVAHDDVHAAVRQHEHRLAVARLAHPQAPHDGGEPGRGRQLAVGHPPMVAPPPGGGGARRQASSSASCSAASRYIAATA